MRIAIVWLSIGVAFLAGQDVEVRQLLSPDSQKTAIVKERDNYRGDTIYLAENGKLRDLLPSSPSASLSRRRRIGLGVWLDPSNLTFEDSCGSGCISFYTLDVNTLRVRKFWNGVVDCCIHWSPSKDRLFVGSSMGSAKLVNIDGTEMSLPGCLLGEKGFDGSWYAYEGWLESGSAVRIVKIGCESTCTMYTPVEKIGACGVRLLWDGKKIEENH